MAQTNFRGMKPGSGFIPHETTHETTHETGPLKHPMKPPMKPGAFEQRPQGPHEASQKIDYNTSITSHYITLHHINHITSHHITSQLNP